MGKGMHLHHNQLILNTMSSSESNSNEEPNALDELPSFKDYFELWEEIQALAG